MLFKNTTGQKALVFAYDKTTGAAKTGDAANITAAISLDGASSNPSDDTNPTEIGGGWYVFNLLQAETNCNLFLLYAASATSNILVTSVMGYTEGGKINDTITSRAAASTALTNATWTDAKAGYLDAAISTRSSHSAADVWSSATRTLSSFGSLVTDIVTAVWGAAARTLTAFGFTVATDISTTVSTNLDATVSSRSTYAGGAVASVTAPVTVGTNNDKTGYALTSTPATPTDVLTQVNVALDAAGTELSAVPGVTGSIRQKLNYVFQLFKLRRTATATLQTLYKDDSATPLGTGVISDDGTTFTQDKVS